MYVIQELSKDEKIKSEIKGFITYRIYLKSLLDKILAASNT